MPDVKSSIQLHLDQVRICLLGMATVLGTWDITFPLPKQEVVLSSERGEREGGSVRV